MTRSGVAGRSLVVLPTYNEAQNAPALTREVLDADPSLDALVVDDGSPDGTGDRVAELARDEPRLHLIQRGAKLGLGSAYRAGFRFGLERGYGRVLTMDCDWSHHPRYLRRLLERSSECGLVIGSRYVPGGGIANWPPHRRLLSAFANRYTRALLRLPVRDCTSGYRCYAREVLETVDPFDTRASGYSFLEEMVWRVHRAGFRIAEIPIVFEDRLAGASKISHVEVYRAAWHVLDTAVRRPRVAARRAPATLEPGPAPPAA